MAYCNRSIARAMELSTLSMLDNGIFSFQKLAIVERKRYEEDLRDPNDAVRTNIPS